MNSIKAPNQSITQSPALEHARAACARIAPLWPLKHFVAVNPFLGLAERSFVDACDLIRKVIPNGMQMARSYYREKFKANSILEGDLEVALGRGPEVFKGEWAKLIAGLDVKQLQAWVEQDDCFSKKVEILTVAEAVDAVYETNWAQMTVEKIAQFCAAYFDEGQSPWRLPWSSKALFPAWREVASLDASCGVIGLRGFRKFVAALPVNVELAIDRMQSQLSFVGGDVEDYLYKLLVSIRGWAGYIQYLVREQRMRGQHDDLLLQLLAIRLAFEAALFLRYDSSALRDALLPSPSIGEERKNVCFKFFWQLADESAWQRQLLGKLQKANGKSFVSENVWPEIQAVFCIDVRSEVFRRALEDSSPTVQTLGFAGFFGMPIEYVPFGQSKGFSQCPVLLTPKYRIMEMPLHQHAEEHAMLKRLEIGRRIAYAWNSFKTSAISCFSFVETAGSAFGVKLIRDAFLYRISNHKRAAAHRPCLEEQREKIGIPFEDRVQLAVCALRNMGLTNHFGRLVLLCGHGSETTNNPYGSSLDCGACGGHAGDVNARVGAQILNDKKVRAALVSYGINIPEDTWVVAGLHNTTTDEVVLFDIDHVPSSHIDDISVLKDRLALAGNRARQERAALLGLEKGDAKLHQKIVNRSRDWAQVRPEWGLAGNAAFIAAPRERTRGVNLAGRVFLHDYNCHADLDNSTLELIMTAPMIVASWINLQYYASTVNNAAFGSGNKVIHNVVGMLGVCQGNGGDLQTGLPFQSVNDGTKWIHEPLRLHVFIEAPRERIEEVLSKHPSVRQLVDHSWLLLFSMEGAGEVFYRYIPGASWTRVMVQEKACS